MSVLGEILSYWIYILPASGYVCTPERRTLEVGFSKGFPTGNHAVSNATSTLKIPQYTYLPVALFDDIFIVNSRGHTFVLKLTSPKVARLKVDGTDIPGHGIRKKAHVSKIPTIQNRSKTLECKMGS